MPELVTQGLQLAMIGMGFVFGFLVLLILLTKALSRLVMLTGGGDAPAEGKTRAVASKNDQDGASQQRLLAVITAAIIQHRTRHPER